ncbi:MAG: AAA family ATPase [Nitrospirae bacterium]|nr:AAA family ATPase [Nitrospirota bacterium]MBF0534231.1 AAA family ATPase [Nitrospirota bacterium]MBF0615855.1 AAA family ATPase [Nitrospirota bacterium]
MSRQYMKYNPAFLTDEELIQSFVARNVDFKILLNIVRENTADSNQHVLVVGQRGSGKTTLLLRVAAEIRKDPELSKLWYPLVFSEESYEVTSIGEFWLEAVHRLAIQLKDDNWQRTYDELKKEKDDKRLQMRTLAQILDLADTEGKRIMLVVENLNMLLGEQCNDSDGWALRHTLLNEPRIMMIASATRRFDEIENHDKAMFELFKIHELRPLSDDECREIWLNITGEEPKDDRIRPIQILTGGSPRLLTIISSFAGKMSFRQLMTDLIRLVDDHTEYFKSHLDALAPVERKVYLAMLDLWNESPARKIADAARLDVNKTSALLNRLAERGAVITKIREKTKLYYVAERMYNIYFLMRKHGDSSSRIKAVVDFMVSFYYPEDLLKIVRNIASEACQKDLEYCDDHFSAYEAILKVLPEGMRKKMIENTPKYFFKHPNMTASLKQLVETTSSFEHPFDTALSLIDEADKKLKEGNYTDDDIKNIRNGFEELLTKGPNLLYLWLLYGSIMEAFKQYEVAEKAYLKAIEIKPEEILFKNVLLNLLLKTNRADDAVKFAEDSTKELPDNAELLNGIAWDFYKSNNSILIVKALAYINEAVTIDSNDTGSQHTLACILCKLNRGKEALVPAKKWIENNDRVEKKIDDTIELATGLAAVGCAKEALEMITESPHANLYEPLICGLRMYLGEDVTTAVEIREIGKDVVKRIKAYDLKPQKLS